MLRDSPEFSSVVYIWLPKEFIQPRKSNQPHAVARREIHFLVDHSKLIFVLHFTLKHSLKYNLKVEKCVFREGEYAENKRLFLRRFLKNRGLIIKGGGGVKNPEKLMTSLMNAAKVQHGTLES